MKSKHLERNSKKFDFSGWLGIAIIIAVVFWFAAKLINGQKIKTTLEQGANAITTAKIIDEKVYMGNSPVSREFYYKYEFYISKSIYYGDSRDSRKQPGDTIRIKYNLTNPEINQPVNR